MFGSFAIPAIGLISAVAALIFLFGCFLRVDSPAFVERAYGDEAKIQRLHSLQGAWDKLGKPRQFVASSLGYCIMAFGLLAVWYEPSLSAYAWLVPVCFAANLAALIYVRNYSRSVLDPDSPGGAEVFKVIRLNTRMCFTFSIAYIALVAVP